LLIKVKRLADERLQAAPEFPAWSGRFEEEIIGAVSEDALEPHLPAVGQLGHVVAVLQQLRRKVEAARIDVGPGPVAKSPA